MTDAPAASREKELLCIKIIAELKISKANSAAIQNISITLLSVFTATIVFNSLNAR